MNATTIERDLVEAIESTLFIFPSVPGRSQDLGIPGLRGRVTKLSHPLLNLCGDARFSEREADAMIEKVRQRYRDLAFGWMTGPSTRPGNLPSRLEAAGLPSFESIAGMALDLAQPIEVDPKTRVREVSWQEATANSEVMARAFGVSTEVMRLFNEIAASSADRIKARPYVASLEDDAIAAWAWLVYLPDSPTVLLGGAATVEEYRGHGLYTALVARRLADARSDGRTTAVVQADRKTSAPICAKLGFREICGLEIFASAHE